MVFYYLLLCLWSLFGYGFYLFVVGYINNFICNDFDVFEKRGCINLIYMKWNSGVVYKLSVEEGEVG